MRVLVINLMRLGDIVQSIPTLYGLRDELKAEVHLLVSDIFKDICQYIEPVSKVHIFENSKILRYLFQDPYSYVLAYKEVKGFINYLKSFRFDLVINLTPARFSALITYLLDPKRYLGASITKDGYLFVNGSWMKALFAAASFRKEIPFNVVDMFIRGSGLNKRYKYRLSLKDEIREKGRALLSSFGVRCDDRLLGFQVGASRDDRIWPAFKFAKLCDILSSYGFRILLFGAKGEIPIGDKICELARAKPVNLVGKTSLGELLAILERCELLVSNDTGTMHIASALGKKVIEICVGPAYYISTGPYGQGHLAVSPDIPCSPCDYFIECKDQICKEVISVDDISNLCLYLLGESHRYGKISSNVKVKVSGFAPDGMLYFFPQNRSKMDESEFFSLLFRYVFCRFLDGGRDIDQMRLSRWWKDMERYYDGFSLSFYRIQQEIKSFNNLFFLFEEASLILSKIEEAYKKRAYLRDLCKNLVEINGMLKDFYKESTYARSVAKLFLINESSLEGEDIKRLIEENRYIYSNFSHLVAMMREALTKSLEIYHY